MAKKLKDVTIEGNTISGTAEGIVKVLKKAAGRIQKEAAPEKPIDIKAAVLKDDFCNYRYELKTGPTAGDSLNRDGASIVHNDMKTQFKKLNVHLAVICEEIDHDDITDVEHFENLDFAEDHVPNSTQDRVAHFTVSSFKVEGNGENESVVLIGRKRLSTGDFVSLKSPKITWEGQYAFINELRVAVDDLKLEVEAYMNGKAAPKLVQQEMPFGEEDKNEEED